MKGGQRAGTAVVVMLEAEDRERLVRAVASAKSEVRAVLRAKIVLAAADGLTDGAAARELKVSVNTVRKWAHPRWHVRWTPPHASWLNQVELFFSALTRRVLRHGDFADCDDLIDKLEAYTIGHNETAKPYRWTYEGTPLKAA